MLGSRETLVAGCLFGAGTKMVFSSSLLLWEERGREGAVKSSGRRAGGIE